MFGLFVYHINIKDLIVLGIGGLTLILFGVYIGGLYLINKIKGRKIK